ncbi:MAG: hypothetical protein AB8B62_11740 [Roseobacter sp.]
MNDDQPQKVENEQPDMDAPEISQVDEIAKNTQEDETGKPAKSAKKNDLNWAGVAGKAMNAPGQVLRWSAGAITSPFGIVVTAMILIYAFAPIDRTLQSVESFLQDHVRFDQSREGLIVVDTPQLFTRERLINERLQESAWIETQLEEVDQLLENDKFAQVDTVSVTRRLMSIVGKDGQDNLEAADFAKLSELAENLGLSKPTPLQQFRDAKNYRERLSLQRYDSILDDAHDIGSNTLHRMNFRLTLSPARERSDSVAAVSITVREPRDPRLLFDHYGRLVVETRKRMELTVDSLLRDRRLILDRDFQFQASELELIDQILTHRVLDLKLVDARASDRGSSDIYRNAQRMVDRMVNLVLKQQANEQESRARAYLHTLINSVGIPTLTEDLMPNYPADSPTYWNDGGMLEPYAINAPKRMIESCGAPFRITSLSPADLSLNDERYRDMRSKHVRSQLGPSRPKSNNGAPIGANESGPDAPSKQRPRQTNEPRQPRSTDQNQKLSTAEAARQLSNQFQASVERQFNYPCPTRENQITLAKLRLIGRFEMLKRVGIRPFAPCRTAPRTREKLIGFIGGEVPSAQELRALDNEMQRACPSSDLLDVTVQLAERVDLAGGDYAQIGIVMMLKEKLTNLQLDTSARTVNLGKFFVFDITRCDLKYCKLRTRTKAEALAERVEAEYVVARAQAKSLFEPDADVQAAVQKAGPGSDKIISGIDKAVLLNPEQAYRTSKARVSEAGREEALRLFLELRCFADARSYTVWPRSGERLASYERDSLQSGARFDFAGTLQKFTGLQARSESDTISRHERDHIFGIGDWGHYLAHGPKTKARASEGGFVPCRRELEDVLDAYEISGTFVQQFSKSLEQKFLGQGVSDWWMQVRSLLEASAPESCNSPDCALSLEALMQVAQELEVRNTQTKFSWLIAPRRESARQASRHVPMSVPLSALISLPSWWGHAELEITTCWVRPQNLKKKIPTGNLCEDVAEEEPQFTRHTLNVPLPGKAQDVLQRIGFFIIRTPYLDTGWNEEEQVEAGRPARIRLTGSRLWKNPRVRVGNQWHDRIEVLPNMQGVIASFECIQPTLRPDKLTVRLRHEDLPRFGTAGNGMAGYEEGDCDEGGASDGAGPPGGATGNGPTQCSAKTPPDDALYVDNRLAEIWTSEGRTSPTTVKVHAFRPRYFRNGEIEQPCWLDNDTRTGMSLQAPAEEETEDMPDMMDME